jgi:hypothetical protein
MCLNTVAHVVPADLLSLGNTAVTQLLPAVPPPLLVLLLLAAARSSKAAAGARCLRRLSDIALRPWQEATAAASPVDLKPKVHLAACKTVADC